MKMTAFRKAPALAGQRYDRGKLLSITHELVGHYRMSGADQKKMVSSCGHLADVLDHC